MRELIKSASEVRINVLALFGMAAVLMIVLFTVELLTEADVNIDWGVALATYVAGAIAISGQLLKPLPPPPPPPPEDTVPASVAMALIKQRE